MLNDELLDHTMDLLLRHSTHGPRYVGYNHWLDFADKHFIHQSMAPITLNLSSKKEDKIFKNILFRLYVELLGNYEYKLIIDIDAKIEITIFIDTKIPYKIDNPGALNKILLEILTTNTYTLSK